LLVPEGLAWSRLVLVPRLAALKRLPVRVAPSDALALDMLMVAVASGSICFLLFWITSREKNEPA
jgi:hypothetical protein